MTVRNNEVLGYIQCVDCDDRATVHKTKRGKSRYFYTRCACGCDQRTGKAVQTKIYENTEWLGETPEPPPGYQPKVVEATEQPAQEPKKQPKVEPESQPELQPKTTEEQPAKPLVLGLVGLAAAVALATIGVRL